MSDETVTIAAEKPFTWLGSTKSFHSGEGYVTLRRGDVVHLTLDEARSERYAGKLAPVAQTAPESVETAAPSDKGDDNKTNDPANLPGADAEPAQAAPIDTPAPAPGTPREDAIRQGLAGTVPQVASYVTSLAPVDLPLALQFEQEGAGRASVLKIINGRIAAITTKA